MKINHQPLDITTPNVRISFTHIIKKMSNHLTYDSKICTKRST